MANSFRRGQKLICTHYKNHRVVVVLDVVRLPEFARNYAEIWVKDEKGKEWWGPPNWFSKMRNKKSLSD